MKFRKEYSIEWEEECEANSFEEAEKMMDKQAEKGHSGDDILKHAEVEYISGCKDPICIRGHGPCNHRIANKN